MLYGRHIYQEYARKSEEGEGIVLTPSFVFQKGMDIEQLRKYIADNLIGITVALDKPAGMTSFEALTRLKWIVFDSMVVNRKQAIRDNEDLQRKLFQRFKCGHAGTLDPMATGLMLMMLGDRAVKRTAAFQGGEKTYLFGMQLGSVTHSYDCMSQACIVSDMEHARSITREQMERLARSQFVGTIEQRVPLISAVKVGGDRLYKRLSESKQTFSSWDELYEIQRAWCPVKEVHISELECVDFDAESAQSTWRVRAGSGTYVRSIIHDMGEQLDRVGAHMISLRREGIGRHTAGDAWKLEDLAELLGCRVPYESSFVAKPGR